MINITHSLGGINIVLALLSFGIINETSIWFILLSIYLGQFMDLDHENSGIGKKVGLRSFGKIIKFITEGHRQETHSIFFSVIIAILLLPLNLYVTFLDGSSIIANFLTVFFAVFSHAILDMINKEPIPLFYCPILNPLEKCKYYTFSNMLSNLTGIKKLTFNFGLAVSSENEFRYVTLPLIFLFFILIFSQFNVLVIKIFDGSNLIVQHPILTVLLLIFSVKDNYLFKEEGGFPSFAYNISKNIDKLENWNIQDLKKIFWEGNFTKILTLFLIIYSISFNSSEFLTNLLNSVFQIKEFIYYQFTNGDNILEKIIKTVSYFIF